ncbi:MAG: hypothetical protein KDK37_00720 [Leptospiraceae bacterium]|nr:hypothetical protein [Leptospiraceae bacterium]
MMRRTNSLLSSQSRSAVGIRALWFFERYAGLEGPGLTKRFFRFSILIALSILAHCSPFLEQPANEQISDFLPVALLFEEPGDCAFIRSPGANDFQVEVKPIPPAGCNQYGYFGADYQAYVSQERDRLVQVEAFLQQTAPTSCTATITAVQGYIASPATNPVLVSTANFAQLVGFQVVDGPRETSARINTVLTGAGFSSVDAQTEISLAGTPNLTDYESKLSLVESYALAQSDPPCQSAIQSALNLQIPGWVADQLVDPVYTAAGASSADPIFFLGRCVYGSANVGSTILCTSLQ